MKNKNVLIGVSVAVILIVIVGVIVQRGNTPSSSSTNNANTSTVTDPNQDTDGDGIPDISEQTLGTNPKLADSDGDGVSDLDDSDPVYLDNPISNDSTAQGFKIVSGLVENNVDEKTKKGTSDHLEIIVENTTNTNLSNFVMYYTITDTTTNKKEGYYYQLDGFTLKAGEKKSIHIDSSNTSGHFIENPNSIYSSSVNAKVFDVFVSTDGFRVENIKINKDPGGEELAD